MDTRKVIRRLQVPIPPVPIDADYPSAGPGFQELAEKKAQALNDARKPLGPKYIKVRAPVVGSLEGNVTENETIKRRRRKTPYPLIGYRKLGDGTKVPIYDQYGRTTKSGV